MPIKVPHSMSRLLFCSKVHNSLSLQVFTTSDSDPAISHGPCTVDTKNITGVHCKFDPLYWYILVSYYTRLSYFIFSYFIVHSLLSYPPFWVLTILTKLPDFTIRVIYRPVYYHSPLFGAPVMSNLVLSVLVFKLLNHCVLRISLVFSPINSLKKFMSM